MKKMASIESISNKKISGSNKMHQRNNQRRMAKATAWHERRSHVRKEAA